jgi:hypothetical protein
MLGERARAAELARDVGPRFPADAKLQAIVRDALRGAR